jgi:hypothetical protein
MGGDTGVSGSATIKLKRNTKGESDRQSVFFYPTFSNQGTHIFRGGRLRITLWLDFLKAQLNFKKTL